MDLAFNHKTNDPNPSKIQQLRNMGCKNIKHRPNGDMVISDKTMQNVINTLMASNNNQNTPNNRHQTNNKSRKLKNRNGVNNQPPSYNTKTKPNRNNQQNKTKGSKKRTFGEYKNKYHYL